MEKNNMTAVELLEKKLKTYLSWSTFLEKDFQEAKQMEKEQIFHAFEVGCHVESTRLIGYHGIAEQYYNEMYKP